ncbi:hypothetical protein M2169_005183 [Streptomyces sp. MJP52]|nr:hypothetical protein [Streptomyces sp. MJP52]
MLKWRSGPWVARNHSCTGVSGAGPAGCGARGAGGGRRAPGGRGGGEAGDGLVAEDVLRRQVQAGGAGAGDDLDAEDGVAAQLEEVVGDAHPGHAQHLGPDPGQGPFGGGARGDVLPFAPSGGGVRGGQGAFVQLAAGGQRQRVEDGEGRGDHVLGQDPAQGVAERGPGGGGGGRGGDDVGGEPGVTALVGRGDDRGGGQLRQVEQGGLDLAGLDAVAAHLHLVVGAAEVVDAAVGGPAGQVAGAVHAGAGRAERVGDEAGGGQSGTARVAAGHLLARQVQFAADAGRHRPQPVVEDVGPHVGQRAADQGAAVALDPAGEGVDGALGGAVEVVRGDVPVCREFAPQAGADGLAADHQHPRAVAGVGEQPGGQQLAQVGRGHVEEVDAVLDDVLHQGRRVQAGRPVDEVQRVAVGHQQHALEGGVEGERRGERHVQRSAAGLGDEALAVRGEQVRHRAVGHGDALGAAGGAGGVDDVGGVVGVGEGAPAGVRGSGGVLQCGAHRRLVEDQGGPGVVEEVPDAFLGQRRVEGEVAGARLPHGEDRDDHVGGARQAQGDQPLGSGAAGGEVAREPFGAGVEGGVVQAFAAGDEGGGVRGAGGPLLEELGQERGGDGAGGVVPVLGDLAHLGLGEQRERAEGAVGCGGGAREQAPELVGRPAGGVRVDQVGAVLQQAGQRLPVGHELDAEVEGGGLPGHGDRGGGEAAERGGRGRGRVQQDHHVEQRVAARLTGGADGLHEPLERRVAVREGVVDGVGGRRQQVAEGAGGLHRGAQHDGGGEEADGAFQVGAGAARGEGAHGDVVLPGPAGQQCLAGGGQGGEQGGVLLGGEGAQPGGDVGGDGEGVHGARPGLLAAARPVQGQGGRHGAAQSVRPVGQFAFQAVAGQPLALPHREVRVLGGHRRQVGRLAVGQGVVGGAEFLQHHARRPSVGDDVVGRQQQDVRVVGLAEQQCAQQRAGAQVEGAGVLGEQRVPRAFRGHLAHRQRDGGGLVDPLHGAAVRSLVEGGAQRLVAGRHQVQGAAEGALVERSGEPQCDGAVVAGVAGAQAVQEPQALLGEGQRQRAGAVGARDVLPGGGPGRGRGAAGQPAAQGLPEVLGQGLGAVSLRRRHRGPVLHRS